MYSRFQSVNENQSKTNTNTQAQLNERNELSKFVLEIMVDEYDSCASC